MTTTKADIRAWLNIGRAGGYSGYLKVSHMIVVTDVFDYEDYPVFVEFGADPVEKIEEIKAQPMTKVMECYDLTMPIEPQIDSPMAWNVVRRHKSETASPPERPLVMEADPEIEALLAEEEEIERTPQDDAERAVVKAALADYRAEQAKKAAAAKRRGEPTWRNTFEPKRRLGSYRHAYALAVDGGYTFVAWNGTVYPTDIDPAEINLTADKVCYVEELDA